MNQEVESHKTFKLLESMGSQPEDWNRVLYIGWHPNTFGSWKGDWYINHILQKREQKPSSHTIIERSKLYYIQLCANKVTREHKIECVLGDVVGWAADYSGEKFDLVIWWHGPEHIEEKYLRPTLKHLENMCRDSVIIGCPEGKDPRNIEDDYVDHLADDKHHYNVTEEDMIELGYKTEVYPRDDWRKQGPALTAIKRVKE